MSPIRAIASIGLLTGLLASGGAALAQSDTSILRVTPGSDVNTFDPTGPAGTAAYIHGMMVYDALYGQDEELRIHPQMVERDEVSSDSLTWTITLREGLAFHDGSPVTTADVIASLRRWMGLDVVGRTMALDVEAMEPVDARTFRIRLKRAFPVRAALANSGSGLPVILREREASAGPFTRGTELIGSGPFRFVANEFRPGDRLVYERFDGYRPRVEPPSGFAGGKVVRIPRLEFHILPDASTKAAALQAGEIDFIDQVPFDQAEAMQGRRGITVAALSRIYNPFFMRPNSLYPPFNNADARRALALAIHQPDYMAVSFVRPEWGQPCHSFFVCGSPNGITTGSEPYRQQNLAEARRLLERSGYRGEPIVLLNSRETLFVGVAGELAAQNLREAGFNIVLAESDWGTLMARRNSRNPPDRGGFNLFITSISGSGVYSPLSNSIADTTCGARNFAGWACDEEAARLRDEYIHEPDEAKQREILERLSRRLWDVMPTVILGQRAQLYAWRNNISGFVRSPSLITIFWNIEKR
ncbi:ABC transporter substrate-binding protein [Neoroseomonas alba]|uniref:ABC transporter substrate-binding protein n=1 Tax=Roseomonas alba TaxID=2846776 RepID=UPI001C9330C8|nr:ABC transporter substrate-binding protein [Neoroseomonas alba]